MTTAMFDRAYARILVIRGLFSLITDQESGELPGASVPFCPMIGRWVLVLLWVVVLWLGVGLLTGLGVGVGAGAGWTGMAGGVVAVRDAVVVLCGLLASLGVVFGNAWWMTGRGAARCARGRCARWLPVSFSG